MSLAPARFRGHYDITGSGPVVLCLAGFGCDNWIFQDMAELLKDHFSLVMPDNRGMGKSPAAQTAYAIEDLANDALDLMEDLGHERFHVIGISMGGFIAQALCLKAPEKVDRLVLMCTTSGGDDFVPLPEMTKDQLITAYQMEASRVVKLNTELTIHPSLKHRSPETYEHILRKKLEHRAGLDQVLLQREAATTFLTQTQPLDQITPQTLVLSGDADTYVDPKNCAILASKLPHAETRLIEDTNHLFFLEKTEEVSAQIRHFLEKP